MARKRYSSVSWLFSSIKEVIIINQIIDIHRYQVIPRTLIFVRRGEEVLLLRGASDKKIWANLYNGVGGHIERGEDVLTSARRELYEETGLREISLWLCGMIMIDTGSTPGIGLYVFQGEYQSGELFESDEGRLEWHPCSNLKNLPLVEDLYQILPRILDMKTGDIPFAACYRYDDEGSLHIDFAD